MPVRSGDETNTYRIRQFLFVFCGFSGSPAIASLLFLHAHRETRESERESDGTEFYSKNPVKPNPTGSRPSDLSGLCRQHTKPDPPITKERQGGQGNPDRRKGAAGKGGEGAQGL